MILGFWWSKVPQNVRFILGREIHNRTKKQTNTQTVTDISTACLLECGDNKTTSNADKEFWFSFHECFQTLLVRWSNCGRTLFLTCTARLDSWCMVRINCLNQQEKPTTNLRHKPQNAPRQEQAGHHLHSCQDGIWTDNSNDSVYHLHSNKTTTENYYTSAVTGITINFDFCSKCQIFKVDGSSTLNHWKFKL